MIQLLNPWNQCTVTKCDQSGPQNSIENISDLTCLQSKSVTGSINCKNQVVQEVTDNQDVASNKQHPAASVITI